MDDDAGRRGSWRLRTVMSVATAAMLLGGCGAGDEKTDQPGPSASGGSATPTASGSPSLPASPSSPASPSAGGDASTLTPFQADPAQVPRTKGQAEKLAAAVALRPAAWGAGFRAQQPAASTPGTVAVLDEQCRWERRALPKGVLASLSRYSEIPGSGAKGEIKVTAAVTVHATVLDADERLATTLEEPLRCREQQVRTDERISGLMSTGTPYGQGNNTYADDQVVEIGSYLTGDSQQTYRWYVTRLGTVTVAVSVKGAKGYSDDELGQYASHATTTMLSRVEFELGGQS